MVRMYLEGAAVGGEKKEGREGDGEEALDEEEVLAAEGLGPLAGVEAHQLLDGELEGDLFGLVEEEDARGGGGGRGGPGVEGAADEAVDVREEGGVADGGGGGKAGEGEGVHALVTGTAHEEEGVGAQQRGDGRRVAALHSAALRPQHHPVELRVRREHRALPEDVRREQPPVPPHPLVDERLRVLRLVRRDQPQRLPHHRQPHAPRRQPPRCRPRPPPPPQFPKHYTCNYNEHHIEQLKRPPAGIHNSPHHQASVRSRAVVWMPRAASSCSRLEEERPEKLTSFMPMMTDMGMNPQQQLRTHRLVQADLLRPGQVISERYLPSLRFNCWLQQLFFCFAFAKTGTMQGKGEVKKKSKGEAREDDTNGWKKKKMKDFSTFIMDEKHSTKVKQIKVMDCSKL
ncbi:hypothetical protein MUK42_00818 [Musa troglodytarum]|uniref:Uncharacterized protein n=1 Tax=Musa troglodytarum TaxID=320322 RepID=A0A9E7FBM6_9LILI|nr:hypothetical protein MUK42_00818 [Musa troglodytarum]